MGNKVYKAFTFPELIDMLGQDRFLSIGQLADRRWETERRKNALNEMSPYKTVVEITKELRENNEAMAEAFRALGLAVYALYRMEMSSKPLGTKPLDPDVARQNRG